MTSEGLRRWLTGTGTLALALLAACGAGGTPEGLTAPADAASTPTTEEAVVNVYNWYDYVDPALLREFEARTGLRVRYDVYDGNETLEAKLLAGRSSYDVVFPSGAFLERLTAAGVFRPLDFTQLPNRANLDPAIDAQLARHDPEPRHALVYTWGITGFVYDAAAVAARLGADAPVDSWSLLFDPGIAARLADCGIGLYESPGIVFPSAIAWLGGDPLGEDQALLDRAAEALLATRPSIRKITNSSLVEDLATGELCVALASNGDARQARERARIAGRKVDLRYVIPREGAILWFDTAAIPADAPHPRNAHRFIDFLLYAGVAARNTNHIGFPNGNLAAQAATTEELRNTSIYPQGDGAARLIPELRKSEDYVRRRTRAWTKFRTGQ